MAFNDYIVMLGDVLLSDLTIKTSTFTFLKTIKVKKHIAYISYSHES